MSGRRRAKSISGEGPPVTLSLSKGQPILREGSRFTHPLVDHSSQAFWPGGLWFKPALHHLDVSPSQFDVPVVLTTINLKKAHPMHRSTLLPLLLLGCATTSKDRQISSLEGSLNAQTARCASQTAQGTKRLDALAATNRQLTAKLQDELKKGQVSINLLEDQLRLSVLQEVLFDSGSAELRESGREVLDKVGSALKDVSDELVSIEGHTDTMQIGPSILAKFPTNWELSTARATTVVRYLQDKGVPPQVLSATGFGEYRPTASNQTEEGRQQNRRIEVVLSAQVLPASRETPPTASSN
jgi:flagellar motor protein MotB